MCVLLSVCVCARARARACVCMRAHACRQSVDGTHNARMGFEFMKHAQQNPEMMQDVMKDLQDPEAMAKVQEMMQVGSEDISQSIVREHIL